MRMMSSSRMKESCGACAHRVSGSSYALPPPCTIDISHEYRLSSLQVFLPVTSCIVDSSAAIYIMVVKFRNTICPPPPQLSLQEGCALSSNSNGTRSVYSRKNPKRSLYSMACTILHSAFSSTPFKNTGEFGIKTAFCVAGDVYWYLLSNLF
jgi:hypothetical protein